MKRLPMSKAAAGLLRGLLNRVETERDRILLTDIQSTDWQSLTYVGEQHRLAFRISGDGAYELAEEMTDGLEDATFSIPGQIVADVALVGEPEADGDALSFTIEALTIAD